jgi:hypothetical protein
MTITTFVAWWGAILATVVFLWDVWKYLHKGPRVRFEASGNMKRADRPPDHKTYLHAQATNYGDGTTTVTTVGYQYFKKRPFLWRWEKPDFAAIVPIPSTAQPLPFELKPGAVWQGMAVQTEDVEKMANDGWLFMILQHSHNKKQLHSRLNLRAGSQE